jgi:hypothetical protein
MPDPLQEAYKEVIAFLNEKDASTLQQILDGLKGTAKYKYGRSYGEPEVRAIYWWLREKGKSTSKPQGTLVYA